MVTPLGRHTTWNDSKTKEEGGKEENASFNNILNNYFYVILHQTYGKGPLSERKPTAAT